jgi:RNA polymerase sigma-70 factor, ECF subfamily
MNTQLEIKQKYLEGYDQYNDAIFRYCLFETSKRDVAIDLTQDTFIKVWEYMAEGKEIENMKAFLYRVARNIIIDYRRKKKSVSLDALSDEGFDVGVEDHKGIMDSIDGKKLLELIDDIPETYRDVVVMRFVEDMSIKEITEITGEAENTISVRLHRAIEKLRTVYNEKMA